MPERIRDVQKEDIRVDQANLKDNDNTYKEYKSKANVLKNVPPNLKGLNTPSRCAYVGNSYTKFHARMIRAAGTTTKSGTSMLGGISALFDTTGNAMRKIVDKMQSYAKEHCQQVDKFREIKQKERADLKSRRIANIESIRSNIMSAMMADYQKNAEKKKEIVNEPDKELNTESKSKGEIVLDKDTLAEIERVSQNEQKLNDEVEYDK